MAIRDELELVKTMYGDFVSWKKDLITQQLQQYSAHTRNELAMLRSVIGKSDCILDIGAHIGTFSIPFALFTEKKGKVYSFEPNESNYELLARNVVANGLSETITTLNALVTVSKCGYVSRMPDGGNTGMFFYMPTNESSTELKQINIDEWHDEFLKQEIHLIKIDVEGAEMSVLRSCKDVLSRYKPILYIEINKSHLERFGESIARLEEFLDPFGYHYFRNVGHRNSTNDNYKLARVNAIHDGGGFFDLLAIHPTNPHYPKSYLGSIAGWFYKKKTRIEKKLRRRNQKSK